MKDSGDWWYDRRNAAGATTDPSVNADMFSAFWMVKGREFKITRSDAPGHMPLLQTCNRELLEWKILQCENNKLWRL